MKFEPKSTMCTFINYKTYSKAYILVDCTTRKVKISRDIVFNESASTIVGA
jgi:hypothetical protein